MEVDANVKNLVKILIGAAWIDGVIQPEEREYLHRIAKAKGVADDPDIQPLLHELRAVKPEECYGWMKEYLGDRPSSEACQQLIEAISGLIYSDGTVANEEARLLTNLQNLEASEGTNQADEGVVLKTVRNLYQRWIAKLNSNL
jgi:uncharacterized tellurite resistance protein B-like protein